MERFDITIKMYSADEYGTQYVWEKVPDADGDYVLYTDAQATIAALTEALECALLEKPLPNGEYVHHTACNGDRRKPAGTVGISCSCRVGKATIAALQARVQELEQAAKETHGRFISEQAAKKDVIDELTVALKSDADGQVLIDKLMQDVLKLESQLTQRTAELEAAKRLATNAQWQIDYVLAEAKKAFDLKGHYTPSDLVDCVLRPAASMLKERDEWIAQRKAALTATSQPHTHSTILPRQKQMGSFEPSQEGQHG